MSISLTAQAAVVGAGPAGLAAAVAAAEAGASVVVVDAGAQPGGQYWRHRSESSVAETDGRGHHDWGVYLDLRARFDAACERGLIKYLPRTHVWMAQKNPDGAFTLRTTATAGLSRGGTVSADQLILCTGAYDRQLPVPGWDLPGVMAAGGIQAFIKANGLLPGKRFVVAGTGPFLLPVAANIADAGGTVVAVCESSAPAAWLPHLGAALGVPGKALEGIEYATAFARHRIPYRTRTVVTEVIGKDRAQSVAIARINAEGTIRPGTERILDDVDVVGFGWGFTPQLELPLALGVETHIDRDGSLVGIVDDRQQSSVPGLFLAGEVTGVGGASLAVLEGFAAGAAAAGSAPASNPRVPKYRRFARAMHAAHPIPRHWQDWLTPNTIICRCEDVTEAHVREAITTLGAHDARTLKSFTRTGMGWCQGRVCGYATACLTSQDGSRPTEASLRAVSKRTMAAPVSVGELAALIEDQHTTSREDEKA